MSTEVEGDTKPPEATGRVEGESKGKEGQFLLGSPSYEDIGKGRMRCVATGHELVAKDTEAYGKSKACRVGLIDDAVAKKKPPLNMFKPDPLSKSKLICKLTGYTINKTEEHIWKHITGKRFLNQLEEKEVKETATVPDKSAKKMRKEESSADKPNKLQKNRNKKNQKKKEEEDAEAVNVEENGSVEAQPVSNNGCEPEETDFWTPPVGERWDYDNGKDRWVPRTILDGEDGEEEEEEEEEEECAVDDIDSADLSTRTKRMSIAAVGPSSYASAKKKRKTADNSIG